MNDMIQHDFFTAPANSGNWEDLEALFGKNGACGGCWCVYWRLTRKQFDHGKGEHNKSLLKSLLDSETPPGLIGYMDGKPAGWVSLGPRDVFPGLGRSRVLKPIDDQPVWSVVCFFIAKSYRKMGLSQRMLQAAVEFSRQQGANILEGYPVQPSKPDYPDVYLYTGAVSMFLVEGFVEVARHSTTRPIMRKVL